MQSRYKLADVENLKSELELLPEVERESREVSLKDAMKVLLPVLKDMRQRRGYTNEQLLQVLRDKGIHIARSSLKDYLRGGRRPRSNARRDGAKATTRPAPGQSEAATKATIETGAPTKDGAAAPPVKPAGPPVLPPPSAPRSALPPRTAS
jgi:hypothetical protein